MEGVDPDKVKGDPVYWISDNGKGATYVEYGQKEWEYLNSGKAKL